MKYTIFFCLVLNKQKVLFYSYQICVWWGPVGDRLVKAVLSSQIQMKRTNDTKKKPEKKQTPTTDWTKLTMPTGLDKDKQTIKEDEHTHEKNQHEIAPINEATAYRDQIGKSPFEY